MGAAPDEARGPWRDVPELAVELDVTTGRCQIAAEQGDVLVGAGASTVPRHAHGVGLFLHPADTDTEETSASRVAVDRGELAGVEHGVADRESTATAVAMWIRS